MGEYDAAREHYQAGLALAESVGDRKGIADHISGLGEADMRQGLLDEAEAKFKQSQAIRMELGLAREIAYDYMNLGVIETERNQWEKAHDLFKLCLEWMRKGGSERDLSRALNNYGAHPRHARRQRGSPRAIISRRWKSASAFTMCRGWPTAWATSASWNLTSKTTTKRAACLKKRCGWRARAANVSPLPAYLGSLGDVSFKLR